MSDYMKKKKQKTNVSRQTQAKKLRSWQWEFILSDLTQDDVLGANHQQVAFKLLADFLLDTVVHV